MFMFRQLVSGLKLLTLIEAIDDLRRYKRDKDVNSQKFRKLLGQSPFFEYIPASQIVVGDMVSCNLM